MLVHVIWGNAKVSFALQKYNFEEYPIPFVWTGAVYCAHTGHENGYFFFEEAWKHIFLGEIRCRALEEGRLHSHGNHSMVHLEHLFSGRHFFPPGRELKTI